jgi:hypothetical protein
MNKSLTKKGIKLNKTKSTKKGSKPQRTLMEEAAGAPKQRCVWTHVVAMKN